MIWFAKPQWTVDRPLKDISSKTVRRIFREHAFRLLDELCDHRLEVVLVPAPRPTHQGHMIRVAQSHNPSWYSRLYENHHYFRRDLTERALRRLVQGTDREYGSLKPF